MVQLGIKCFQSEARYKVIFGMVMAERKLALCDFSASKPGARLTRHPAPAKAMCRSVSNAWGGLKPVPRFILN